MKKEILETKPLQINAGLQQDYRKKLRSLCKPMIEEVVKEILSIYKEDKADISLAMDAMTVDIRTKLKSLEKKFAKWFQEKGQEYAERMVMRQLNYSRAAFRTIIKDLLPAERQSLTIKGSPITKEMSQTIKASIAENVQLIKNIQQEYFNRVSGAVYRSIQNGESLSWLKKELMKYNGMTWRRAENIANDQTKKTYTAINLRNFQKYGIKKFKWIHSGGGKTPRTYHITKHPAGLNGGIFDVENPPIIDKKTGERGFPAQLPFCRCVMAAVIDLPEI